MTYDCVEWNDLVMAKYATGTMDLGGEKHTSIFECYQRGQLL